VTQIDHYRILGIPRDARLPAIKAAYRAQVKKHHPDMVRASKGVASSRFCEIVDAFQILCDPQLRAQYDAMLVDARSAPKVAEPPKPPAGKAAAVANGVAAVIELSFWAFIPLLLLVVVLTGIVSAMFGR
jgi:DnaJ-class molecular chaperone